MEDNWPPQWEKLEECPQYKFNMIRRFVEPFDFEDEDHVDDEEYYDSDDDERIVNTHQTVLKFLFQVRTSRGYDVDCIPPSGFDSPFRPVNLSSELKVKSRRDYVMKATNFAIDQINAQSEKHTGKTYKLKNLEKVVETRNLMVLLTYTAMEVVPDADADVKTFQAMVYVPASCKLELIEWRFKPVPGASTGA